jgi:hypothetical protein
MLKRIPHKLWHGNAPLVGDLAGAFKQLSVYLDRFRLRCSHTWILSSLPSVLAQKRQRNRKRNRIGFDATAASRGPRHPGGTLYHPP